MKKQITYEEFMELLDGKRLIGSGIARECYTDGELVWKVPAFLLKEEAKSELSDLYPDKDSIFNQSSNEIRKWETLNKDEREHLVPILDYFYVGECSEPVIVMPKVKVVNKILTMKDKYELNAVYEDMSAYDICDFLVDRIGLNSEMVNVFIEECVKGLDMSDVFPDNLALFGGRLRMVDWGI